MFPKHIRLNLRQERDFFKTANRRNFPLFQLLVKNSDSARFAIIVPKKVSNSSVKRHKILRQMRNIMAKSTAVELKKNLVMVMFPSSLGRTFQELQTAFEQATKQFSEKR